MCLTGWDQHASEGIWRTGGPASMSRNEPTSQERTEGNLGRLPWLRVAGHGRSCLGGDTRRGRLDPIVILASFDNSGNLLRYQVIIDNQIHEEVGWVPVVRASVPEVIEVGDGTFSRSIVHSVSVSYQQQIICNRGKPR